MSARGILVPGRSPDVLAASASMAAVGVGSVLLLAGAAGGGLLLLVAGAGVAAVGLAVVLTAGWVDGLTVLALCLPLPGLVTGEARLHPAAVVTALVVLGWVVRSAALDAEAGRSAAVGAGLPRLPLAALATAVLLSALFARDHVEAARELVDWGALLALLGVATAELARSAAARTALARLLAFVAGTAGFAAVLETIGVLPAPFPLRGTPLNRATLGFGWPNELGMFFAILLPLCVFAWRVARSRPGRVGGALAVVGCLAGLTCTFSRASWLATLAAPAALLLAGRGRVVAGVWLVGMSLVALADVATGGLLSTRVAALAVDSVVEQRTALMLVGVLMFVDHPWVGVGPGGFGTHLGEYGPQVTWLWDYVGSAHNAYVEIAAELGALGLAAFLALVAAVFVRLLASARRMAHAPSTPPEERYLASAALWSFATFATVSVTAWPFAHGLGELVMLVAALGLAAASAGEATA